MPRGVPSKQTALARIAGLALRRGVVGGSRFWLTVGGAATAIRVIRRIAGSGPEVAYSEELPAGQSILITNGEVTASGLEPR